MAAEFGRITVAHDIIYRRYNPSNFIGREWLVQKVASFCDNPEGRHLIIVGEPGSGKTALMAYLAEAWNAPRHFIRVGSKSGTTGVAPRAMLISIGAQLYQKYGQAIFRAPVGGKTSVNIGLAKNKTRVTGRFIQELYTLPFLPLPDRDVVVRVGAALGESKVVGERIGRLIDVTEALSEPELLHVTLLSPLQRLYELHKDEKVIIFIDALDESLSHPGPRIGDIIPRATDQSFPPNLRFVMTSRPEDYLAGFQSQDQLHLSHYVDKTKKDIRNYIKHVMQASPINEIVATWQPEELKKYITDLESSSEDNFLYLYHYFNEIREFVQNGNTDLRQFSIPRGLDDIYRYFAVEKIRGILKDTLNFKVVDRPATSLIRQWEQIPGVENIEVDGLDVTVTASDSDLVVSKLLKLAWQSSIDIVDEHIVIQKGTQPDRWENICLPVLGVMAVVYEAVSPAQIAALVAVKLGYVKSIVAALKQFLDETHEGGRYQLYHRSFAEYLLDDNRNRDFPLDESLYHNKISKYYWINFKNNWDSCDRYGLNHLAKHLYRSGNHALLEKLISRDWFQARYKRGGYLYAGFLEDVNLSWQVVTRPRNPKSTSLVHLATARIIVNLNIELYSDTDLRTLTLLGREKEAIEYAKLRQDIYARCNGLFFVYSELKKNGKTKKALLFEILDTSRALSDLKEKVDIYCRLMPAFKTVDDQKSLKLHNKVLSLIASCDQPNVSAGAWTKLARAAYAADFRDKDKIIGAALKNVYALNERWHKIMELKELALILIKTNDQRLGDLINVLKGEVESYEQSPGYDPYWKFEVRFCYISLLLQLGRYEEARDLVFAIKSRFDQSQLFVELAKYLIKTGQLQEAEKLINYDLGNHQANLYLRAIGLGDLAPALLEINDPRTGTLVDEAIDAAINVIDPQYVQPRTPLYRLKYQPQVNLIKILAALNHFQKIDKFLDAIAGQEVLVRVLSTYAYILATIGNSRSASVLDKAILTKIAINNSESYQYQLHDLTACLTESGYYQPSFRIALLIQDEKEKLNALRDIVEELAAAGKLEEAEEVFKMMPDISYYESIRDLARRAIAIGLAKCRRLDEAKQLVDEIQGQAIKAEGLIRIGKRLYHADNPESAEVFFKEAESIFSGGDYDYERSLYFVLEDYVELLIEIGRGQETEHLIDGFKAGTPNADGMFCHAIKAYAAIGQFEKAMQLAPKIEYRSDQVMSWCSILAALNPDHPLIDIVKEEALKVVGEMKLNDDRVRWKIYVATHLAQVDKALAKAMFLEIWSEIISTDNARLKQMTIPRLVDSLIQHEYLETAQEVLEHVHDHYGRSARLMRIAKFFGHSGDPDRAVLLFQRAREIARMVSDPKDKVSVLKRLAIDLKDIGDETFKEVIEEAKQASLSISDSKERSSALTTLAGGLAGIGCFDAAMQIASIIGDEQQKNHAHNAIANAYLKENNVSGAFSLIKIYNWDVYFMYLLKAAGDFDRIEPGSFIEIIISAIKVTGWVDPFWENVYQTLTERSS